MSLEACGTAQSLGPVTTGDITEGEEEEELLDARSSSGEALFIPAGAPEKEYEDAEKGRPVAEAPAGIGWRIPMVPFGRVVFPMVDIRGLVGVEAIMGLMPVGVGTKGCRPVIAVKGERPGVAMERGVNIAWFVPGILGMLGTGPIP